MLNKVTMKLLDEELALVAQLRDSLKLSTNTGTVVQALKITGLIAEELQSGKQLVFLNPRGLVESRILIPGLSTTTRLRA